MDKNLKGKYRIDHPLFQDIVFVEEETAVNAAERLCLFLIRSSEQRTEASIDVLKYDTDTSDGDIKTIWWFHKTIEATLQITENDE